MGGESKRRKANDPTYGFSKRGLIVSSPIEITDSFANIKYSSLDSQELRFSLLFWDKLVWPSSSLVYLESGPDELFLEQSGVMTRPHFSIGSDGAQSIVKAQIQAFLDLEKKEPGFWSLAQGENSLLIKNELLKEHNGIYVELHRAIPVPDKEVPLDDILEFRRKRYAELVALRVEIDNFVAKVINSVNTQEELATQVARIDSACADALRIGKEWRFPVRLASLKASLDLRPFSSIAAGIVGWNAAVHEMPFASAVLFGLAASFKIGGDFGIQGIRPRQGPYRYASYMHKEIF